MEDPKKPMVRLTGIDGNAFSIMGVVAKALRKAGFPKEHVDKYMEESTSGDYNNLMRVAHKYAYIS